ncbi:hypothetical protein HELRODRAFT_194219 [Helobdella robusta]|uniref:Peptidase S54 rhomboid domain-containing protein n=1 Tax=Helobdella robusta TaxID=6412 RepID=T1FVT7_HELRO|nr:hypothetical protein HELRODRAFT_194219 [Helobdella robusta]ESN92501.1 hypothetical protein HELRODRAFT_194219 [Helobdella robusta]
MSTNMPRTGERIALSNWAKLRFYVVNKKPAAVKEAEASKWLTLIRGTEKFFGVSDNPQETEEMKEKWRARLNQLYGGKGMMVLKGQPASGGEAEGGMEMGLLGTDSIDGRLGRGELISELLPKKKMMHLKPKENVFMMTYDAFMKKDKGVKALKSRSYAPSDTVCRDFFFLEILIGVCRSSDKRKGKFQLSSELRSMLDEDFFKLPIGTGQRRLAKSKRMDTDQDRDMVDSFRPPGRDMIDLSILEELSDTNKREFGTGGFIGRRLFNIEKDDSKISKDAMRQLQEMGDVLHRPYFTYWVTFVQIVCYIVTISVYGLAPIGISSRAVNAEIYSSKMFVESIALIEKENFWIGPRQEDLIHLGAKYSPCMRRDANVVEAIKKDRALENETACCVRNDGLGCVQTPASMCSSILSTWHKTGQSTTVCGQDPNYCSAPASLDPYKWPNDIIDWPICLKSSLTNGTSLQGIPRHMTCQVAGKPCCIGIQGECIVTTREECEFKRGYFHDDAFLCSQVSCIEETCGMLPFWNSNRPDQFYRLWLSLFIHAGVLQLLITILFQFFFMRDVEKMLGWHRTAFIYIMSGVVGSLASAIFVPYHVEAGPSGSQFGILSCLFVELINYWPFLYKPYIALIKLLLVLLLLFVIGLLPMVDNYAHLFGFIFGFLLSFSVMPHVELNIADRKKKLIAVFICFFGSFVILLLLTLLFYVVPIYDCPYCQYFSCIPFTETFCSSMEVKIRRDAN